MAQASAPQRGDTDGLCVALDSPSPERCLGLARAVAPHAAVLKVGLTAFVAAGPSLVREVGSLRPVFLDLKLHDIPAQVAGAVEAAAAHGVAYLTVHAAGGAAMVQAAARAAGAGLRVLAVTVLTSIDEDALATTGVTGGVGVQVERLAALALEAGAEGLVCSPREVAALRGRFGERAGGGPILVVPGARAPDAPTEDQRRVGPAATARADGADLVVIGRAITGADDPAAAAERVAAELRASERASSGA